MKAIASISLAPALVAGLLLTGCDAWSGYRHVPYEPGNQPAPEAAGDHHAPYGVTEHHARAVRGTVERVDPGAHVIVLQPGQEERGELVLSYDDDTKVEYHGQRYRPENLERGDRIDAAVERTPDGFSALAIQVTYDASSGEGQEDQGREATAELRGVVRSNDTDEQTVEIQPAGPRHGPSDVVVVHYDDETVVEFQGRRYGPENLERGDAVEIELRDARGEPTANRILVVGEGRPVR